MATVGAQAAAFFAVTTQRACHNTFIEWAKACRDSILRRVDVEHLPYSTNNNNYITKNEEIISIA
eukprot:5521466-Amphidinium_carterae.1